MKSKITRRDFLNGVQVAVGASLFLPSLSSCAAKENNFSLPQGYYPPLKTGMRGNHDGSWETMHEKVSGKTWDEPTHSETYDLMIVGAGISGLAAGYFYKEQHPNAQILILDNHDDFGGHAKRNEFDHNGDIRIGYGGTEAIDTPSHYTTEAKKLLKDIGIDMQRFYDYYDQDLYQSFDLSKGIVFDKETYGEEKLVRGYGKKSWEEFAAETPMSEEAKRDFIRIQTSTEDYLPGVSMEEKINILSKTSYEDFLCNYCKVHEEVIGIYRRWGMSFWAVGIDEVPTTAIQSYDGGMPGVEHTLVRTGHRNNEPYIFHFPDGNASVARLLVRALIPKAMPGRTMEDVVTVKADYTALDRIENSVNIRLNSTVVHVENRADVENRAGENLVDLVYVRNDTPHHVRAKKCILACYNMVIPHICPEIPEAQKQALSKGIKAPLVYTKVLVPNWKPFVELGMDFVYYTGGFYKQVELAYPVSMGNYKGASSPSDPMILHMCHTPWVPDIQGPDQWKQGRHKVLTTSFETFESHVKTQLNQALSSTGFDAEKDISAITVNRWPHGYAYNPELIWEPEYASEEMKPWIIGRKPIGNISIANSDAGAKANTNCAITQAFRAVQEVLA